jgi:hypothetical protein
MRRQDTQKRRETSSQMPIWDRCYMDGKAALLLEQTIAFTHTVMVTEREWGAGLP